jgi:LPXTG-site transpeptidase (sortase) family protein
MQNQKSLYLEHGSLTEPTLIPLAPTDTAPESPGPSPTETSVPEPPTRIAVPQIGVNSAITEVKVVLSGNPLEPNVAWQELKRGVGHDTTSAFPGENGNILLFAHNNSAGQVFRRLSELDEGDIVELYTHDRKFSYVVSSVDIIPFIGATVQDQQLHAFYMGPKTEETLTLMSCWPYTTYTHRVYVVAKPAGVSDQ